MVIFSQLKKQLPSNLRDDPGLHLDQQKVLYLKAAADSHVFTRHTNPEELLKTCEGPLDVLEIALGFEKDSVVLYTAMKDLVPKSLGRETIDRLIQEEISHIAMIHDWMERLSRK